MLDIPVNIKSVAQVLNLNLNTITSNEVQILNALKYNMFYQINDLKGLQNVFPLEGLMYLSFATRDTLVCPQRLETVLKQEREKIHSYSSSTVYSFHEALNSSRSISPLPFVGEFSLDRSNNKRARGHSAPSVLNPPQDCKDSNTDGRKIARSLPPCESTSPSALSSSPSITSPNSTPDSISTSSPEPLFSSPEQSYQMKETGGGMERENEEKLVSDEYVYIPAVVRGYTDFRLWLHNNKDNCGNNSSNSKDNSNNPVFVLQYFDEVVKMKQVVEESDIYSVGCGSGGGGEQRRKAKGSGGMEIDENDSMNSVNADPAAGAPFVSSEVVGGADAGSVMVVERSNPQSPATPAMELLATATAAEADTVMVMEHEKSLSLSLSFSPTCHE